MNRINFFNTRVFALSADTIESSAGFSKEMQFPFELLCDPDKKVIMRYHLLNPHEHDGIAYPALFVINSQNRICYRSLDRTAMRVQLPEVLEFLEKLKKTPSYVEKNESVKATIIPSFAEMIQIMHNMVFRGSRADWKHYVKFTFVYAPGNLYKAIRKLLRLN